MQNYCRQLVRERAFRDAYLPTLFLHTALPSTSSKQFQSLLWPVHALQLELDAIPQQTKQPHLQRIRLLWWKEALIDGRTNGDQASTQTLGSPVVDSVRQTIDRLKEDSRSNARFHLRNILRGQEGLIGIQQLDSIEQLTEYSDQTLGSVLRIALESCGVFDSQSDHIVGHVAKAMGICRTLRDLRRDTRLSDRILIPSQVLAENQLSSHQVLKLINAQSEDDAAVVDRFRNAVYQLASEAHVHLETAHKHLLTVKGSEEDIKNTKLVTQAFSFAPQRYLDVLRENEFDLNKMIGYNLKPFDWTLFRTFSTWLIRQKFNR